MGISENTVLARARREKWTHEIVIAKQQGRGRALKCTRPHAIGGDYHAGARRALQGADGWGVRACLAAPRIVAGR